MKVDLLPIKKINPELVEFQRFGICYGSIDLELKRVFMLYRINRLNLS